MVEAGAVAEASAANTIENARFRCKIQNASTKTKTEASNASASVITMTFPALFVNLENLKKAIEGEDVGTIIK